jgi:hypothetical protein
LLEFVGLNETKSDICFFTPDGHCFTCARRSIVTASHFRQWTRLNDNDPDRLASTMLAG